MPNYSFKETISYFSEKLRANAPEEDVEKKEVELAIDNIHVILSQGMLEGSLHIQIPLGLLVRPIKEERLKELATSNFLGVNTGGCKLAFDTGGICLSLHGYTTCGSAPQESWEWLHRTLCVAREWNKLLRDWEEFVPLSAILEEKNEPSSPIRSIRA